MGVAVARTWLRPIAPIGSLLAAAAAVRPLVLVEAVRAVAAAVLAETGGVRVPVLAAPAAPAALVVRRVLVVVRPVLPGAVDPEAQVAAVTLMLAVGLALALVLAAVVPSPIVLRVAVAATEAVALVVAHTRRVVAVAPVDRSARRQPG